MRIVYQLLPVILSVGLVSCGQTAQSEKAQTTEETSNKEENFVSKLPDSAPVVKVGTEANYAPYEFKDEYGNVTGFDIELIRAIGENQGFKIEIYNDPWEELFTNLDNKSRDMVAAGITYSDERASKYLLSNAYAPLPTTISYLDDKLNIQSLDDIKGLKIGVLSQSAPYQFFLENSHGISALEQYPTIFSAVQAMAQNKVDAVASDSGVLRYTMNDLPDLNVKYYDYEDISADGAQMVFMIDRSKPELLNKINTGLQGLRDDGTYAKLTTKWFGTDLTKTSIEQQAIKGVTIAPTTIPAE